MSRKIGCRILFDGAAIALGLIPITKAGARSGVLGVTQDSNTVAATGTLAINGVVGVTQAADVIVAIGTLAITGILSATQDDNTLLATALIGSSVVVRCFPLVSNIGTLMIRL